MLMMTQSLLAQIDFAGLFASIGSENGALVSLLSFIAFLLVLTLRGQIKAETKRKEQKTETAELVNKFAEDATKAERALNEKLLTSERSLGTLEGRIIELSGLVKHNQDKYEKQEKSLAEQIATLTKQFNEQQALIEKLQVELNGKNEKLAALETENKQLTTQNVNAQRDKLDLELERDRLQSLVNEQAAQIELLARQLAEKDPPKAVTVTETQATIITESTKEYSANSDESEAKE